MGKRAVYNNKAVLLKGDSCALENEILLLNFKSSLKFI